MSHRVPGTYLPIPHLNSIFSVAGVCCHHSSTIVAIGRHRLTASATPEPNRPCHRVPHAAAMVVLPSPLTRRRCSATAPVCRHRSCASMAAAAASHLSPHRHLLQLPHGANDPFWTSVKTPTPLLAAGRRFALRLELPSLLCLCSAFPSSFTYVSLTCGPSSKRPFNPLNPKKEHSREYSPPSHFPRISLSNKFLDIRSPSYEL